MDFRTKLPFARDRIVECYFWILGVYFEPEYSFTRAILTKALTLISIVDDIYDVYGTAEERELFMAAIERSEYSINPSWSLKFARGLLEFHSI